MSAMSTCGYRPCSAPIARHLLMCAAHWRLVPKDVQDRVYKYYRAKDWANWGRALDDARVAVATAQGDPIPARLMKPKEPEPQDCPICKTFGCIHREAPKFPTEKL